MFVYYKLYRKPVSPTFLHRGVEISEKRPSSALRLCTRRQEAFIKFAFRTNILLTNNQYSTSQPLLLHTQQAPHKHETEVANPQYLLH